MVVLVTTLALLIQLPVVQNWLVQKITAHLSKELQTQVAIKKVDFSLFNKMYLQGILVKDRHQDTILSAGTVAVNITDWFFLKENIELQYIGLSDAFIHLQRSDSIWRHQFLADYFSSPSDGATKKKGTLNLAIKKVDIHNLKLIQADGWLGQNLSLSLSDLKLNPRKVDFNNQFIDLGTLEINRPHFAIRNYKGNKPFGKRSSQKKLSKPVNDSLKLQWNPDQWNVIADRILLRDGNFKNDNDEMQAQPLGQFDGGHLEFASINGELSNLVWNRDTISAAIRIGTREKSGFHVKHLIAKAKFTPREMTFNDLDIVTNTSHVKNYFSMKYADFGDLNNFIEKVKLEGRFVDAHVTSDDIGFFAPDLKAWKKKFLLNGFVSGPVASLAGKNLQVQTEGATYFKGAATLNGLPNINETFIDVKADDFKITHQDATIIIPLLKTITYPNLRKLEYAQFQGNFTGFINDFVTFGTLQTALGAIKADVNLKLPKGRNPVYSGNVATTRFDLGSFLNDTALGYMGLSAKLKGAGFNPEKDNIALEAKVQYFDYNKYRYQNIDLNGEVNKRVFQGIVHLADSNAHLTLNGLIDYRKAIPEFNFLSKIQKLNLQPLHFTKDSILLTGNINAQFQGKTIDDFLGHASVSEATLIRNGDPLSFDTLALTSTIIDDQKHLTLSSNEFTAQLTGQFTISELPNSVTSFLTHYYPAYIKPPKVVPANQIFSFDVSTRDFDNFAKMIDSSFSGFNNSRITGSINTVLNHLHLTAEVPGFHFKQFQLSDINITGLGDHDSLSLDGSIANIAVTDSLDIPMVKFMVHVKDDVSKVKIFTRGAWAVNQAAINATAYTYTDGVKIDFQPSTFTVNGKNWIIDENGELELRNNMPAHGQLLMRETNQQILVQTQPSDVGNWNDIAIKIQNLNIGDIAPFILPHNRLEGLISSQILIENPGKKMRILTNDFSGSAIRFDNDSLGNISAKALYDAATEELRVDGTTLNPEKKDLAFNMHLYFKDKQSQAKNVIALNATRFDLRYLNRFLEFLFSDIHGEITGKFEIRGPFDGLYVVGKGRLHDAGLKVNFTQCHYDIEDHEIQLTTNEINLNGMVLRDTVTNNPIYLRGSVLHQAFSNMFFDLTVSTRKPGTRGEKDNRPVQVLNTTFNDNKIFYGDVKATGSFALIGPADNSYMKIDAIASTEHQSNFTIASSDSKAGRLPDWMVERKFGVFMGDSLFKNTTANIIYDLDVTANPNLLMKFVMDDLTGDEITGRGSGTLKIRSGSSEPLSIRGQFDIDEGVYNFTFQSFFKKPFIIQKGKENYIAWNGDPMKATIKLDAYYKAERVSFTPLSSGYNLDENLTRVRENVYILATLTGELFRPEFKFGLEMDPNSRASNNFTITNVLNQIQNNENEITRQVTYLIVLNSFAPPESGVAKTGLGNAVNEFGYNTISSISGLLFNEINKKLNSELTKIFGDNVSLVLGGSVYNRNLLANTSSAFNPNQANFTGALSFPIFNDRFIFSLGSSMEVPLQSSLQQTVQFLPDVTLEWAINKSGTIRATLFYRENLDYLTTSSTGAAKLKRTGAGISYRREFESFKDLFQNANRTRSPRLQSNLTDSILPSPEFLKTKDSSSVSPD